MTPRLTVHLRRMTVLTAILALGLPTPGVAAQPPDPAPAPAPVLALTEVSMDQIHSTHPRAHRRVVIVEPDGRSRRLVPDAAWSPSISPDGDLVAYQGRDGIHIVGIDGSGDRLLRAEAQIADDAWSPDGTAVLATIGRSVAIIDVAGGSRAIHEVAEGSYILGTPAWSPDGRRVALVVAEGDGSPVRTVGSDGSDPRTLATDLVLGGVVAWSPDATQVAVIAARRAGDGQLSDVGVHVLAEDGSGSRLLEGTGPAGLGSDTVGVEWSPDGSRIAYDAATPDGGPMAVAVTDPQVGGSAYVAPLLGGVSASLGAWLPGGDLVVVQPDDAPGHGATVLRVALDGRDPLVLAHGSTLTGVAVGPDRIDPVVPATTARALWWSRDLPDGSAPLVLLGRSDDHADALASGGAQGALDAPLLLTRSDRLEDVVARELDRLGTTEVVILGGSAAVSPAVEDDLRGRGLAVRRLAGPSRIETAVTIAESIQAEPHRVVLVRAFGDATDPTRGFVDSLAAGALAAGLDVPLLLTPRDVLAQPVAAWLDRTPSVDEVVVVGGEAAVGDPVVRALEDRGLAVVRLAGAERAATAAAVAAFGAEADGDDSDPPPDPGTVVLVDGEDPLSWADGFAAARLADPTASGGVLLTAGATVLPVTMARLIDSRPGTQLACASLVADAACATAGRALTASDPDVVLRATATGGEVTAVMEVRQTDTATCLIAAVEGATLTAADVLPHAALQPASDGRAVTCAYAEDFPPPPPAEDWIGLPARFELIDGTVLEADLQVVPGKG